MSFDANDIFHINITSKGELIMKVSKLKIITKYFTGGITSVIEYILDLFNDLIQKLPAAEVAKYAQLAADVATFVRNCCVLITSDAKKAAAQKTADAFGKLATALLDSNITKEELDAIIEAVKVAVEAWKNAK